MFKIVCQAIIESFPGIRVISNLFLEILLNNRKMDSLYSLANMLALIAIARFPRNSPSSGVPVNPAYGILFQLHADLFLSIFI